MLSRASSTVACTIALIPCLMKCCWIHFITHAKVLYSAWNSSFFWIADRALVAYVAYRRGRIPSWTYMHNHFPSSSDHVSISPRSSCSSLHDICGTVHNYDVPETPADPSPNGTPKCGTAVSAHVSSSNIIRTESMRSLSLAAQSSLCVIWYQCSLVQMCLYTIELIIHGNGLWEISYIM